MLDSVSSTHSAICMTGPSPGRNRRQSWEHILTSHLFSRREFIASLSATLATLGAGTGAAPHPARIGPGQARRHPPGNRRGARRQQPRRVLLRSRNAGRPSRRPVQGSDRRRRQAGGAVPHLRLRRRQPGGRRIDRPRRGYLVAGRRRQRQGAPGTRPMSPSTWKARPVRGRRNSDVADRTTSSFTRRPGSLDGASAGPLPLDGGKFQGMPITLGEVMTDADGRLVVLPGAGGAYSDPWRAAARAASRTMPAGPTTPATVRSMPRSGSADGRFTPIRPGSCASLPIMRRASRAASSRSYDAIEVGAGRRRYSCRSGHGLRARRLADLPAHVRFPVGQ